MNKAILVLNVGSSSIKFALYPAQAVAASLLSGQVSRVNQAPRLQARWAEELQANPAKTTIDRTLTDSPGTEAALDALLDWLKGETRQWQLLGAGHRVVHGGPEYSAPVQINEQVLAGIARANPAAPSHNPVNLLGIRRVQEHYPELPQIACFDTHFHNTQPKEESHYALPRKFTELGIRRYGFHGLSYDYIASQLSTLDQKCALDSRAAEGRTLVAHLGNGASLCALQAGRSVATTMGFTALEGLMMGQRCGNLDPGVVLYLQQQLGYSADEVMNILSRQSGLLGVSGISNDMRELLASDASEAEEAVALYCHRVIREAGALLTLLGGLDAVVFTGGIGENAAVIRQRIAAGLRWLGLELDDQANAQNAQCISADTSAIKAWVIPTDEEQVIARHTRRLLISPA